MTREDNGEKKQADNLTKIEVEGLESSRWLSKDKEESVPSSIDEMAVTDVEDVC